MTRNPHVTGYQPTGPQPPPPRGTSNARRSPEPHALGHAAALREEPMCAPRSLDGWEANRWCEGWRLGDVERRVRAIEAREMPEREAFR